MEIKVGKTYDVLIRDCCVEGSFTSKLTKAYMHDDDDKPYPVETDEYGTSAEFENGVKLTLMNGVYLMEVKDQA